MKRSIPTARRLSRRAARLCALLRLRPPPAPAADAPDERLIAAAAWLDGALAPGQCALVLGAAGSGKSRLLDTLAVRWPGARRITPFRSDKRVADTIPGPDTAALAWLVRMGVSDPALWLTPTRLLCDTDQLRVSLARAFARARPGDTLLADDFTAALAPDNARLIAHAARAAAPRAKVRFIAASGRDELLEYLAPHALVIGPLDPDSLRLVRTHADSNGGTQ